MEEVRFHAAHAIWRAANDGRPVIRENSRHGRQVARGVAHGARQRDDRRLALGQTVEIAHGLILATPT